MFNYHKHQVIISGASHPVDLEDLKAHTNYSGGYDASHPVIELFWTVVSERLRVVKSIHLEFPQSHVRMLLLLLVMLLLLLPQRGNFPYDVFEVSYSRGRLASRRSQTDVDADGSIPPRRGTRVQNSHMRIVLDLCDQSASFVGV